MRKTKQSESSRMMRPALTPEARENQLVSLAVDLAEKQLREGTASSQVITSLFKAWFHKGENRKRDFREAKRTDRSKNSKSEIH